MGRGQLEVLHLDPSQTLPRACLPLTDFNLHFFHCNKNLDLKYNVFLSWLLLIIKHENDRGDPLNLYLNHIYFSYIIYINPVCLGNPD